MVAGGTIFLKLSLHGGQRPVGREQSYIMSTQRYSNYALTISHILISVLLLSITTRFSSEKMRQVFGNNSNSAWCVK